MVGGRTGEKPEENALSCKKNNPNSCTAASASVVDQNYQYPSHNQPHSGQSPTRITAFKQQEEGRTTHLHVLLSAIHAPTIGPSTGPMSGANEYMAMAWPRCSGAKQSPITAPPICSWVVSIGRAKTESVRVNENTRRLVRHYDGARAMSKVRPSLPTLCSRYIPWIKCEDSRHTGCGRTKREPPPTAGVDMVVYVPRAHGCITRQDKYNLANRMQRRQRVRSGFTSCAHVIHAMA